MREPNLASGDRVRLVRLDAWFLPDMEPELVTLLRGRIGRDHAVAGFDEYGHVELEFTRRLGNKTSFHTVWVDPSWVERVR